MRAALGLALAFALAGCFSHPPPAERAPGAPDPFCRALGSWLQRGVYEAMAGLPGLEEHGPPGALPFEGVPPGFRLSRVAWTVEGARYDSVYAVGASVGGRASLTGLAAPDVPDAEVRARFVALARNATDASEDEARAWSDAFLASRHGAVLSADGAGRETAEQYGYEVDVDPARLRLDALASALDARAERAEVQGRWSWVVDGERWQLDFAAPYRTAPLAGAPEPIGLTADAGGLVRASDDGLGEPATRGEIAAAMRQAGLPEPTFEGWRSDSGIC